MAFKQPVASTSFLLTNETATEYKPKFPTGTKQGYLVLCSFLIFGSGRTYTATGWTQLGTGQTITGGQYVAFYRIATKADEEGVGTTTYPIKISGAAISGTWITNWVKEVNATTPVVGGENRAAAAATTVKWPTATPTEVPVLDLLLVQGVTEDTFTTPTGFTALATGTALFHSFSRKYETKSATGETSTTQSSSTPTGTTRILILGEPEEEGGTAWKKELAETVTVSDAVARGLTKALADTQSASDSLSKKPGKALADSQTSTDALTKAMGKAIADSQSSSDGLAKKLTKAIADSVSVSDSVSASRLLVKILGDMVSVSDALVKGIGKRLSDTATSSDSLAKKTSKKLTETASVSDSLTKGFRKLLGDTVSLVDEVLTRLVTKEAPEEWPPTFLEIDTGAGELAIDTAASALLISTPVAALAVTTPSTSLAVATKGGLELDLRRSTLLIDDRETELILDG